MNTEKKYPGQPDNEIWFYDKDMPYYEFANYFPCLIEVYSLPVGLSDEGKVVDSTSYLQTPLWKSSEQLFHAMKFTEKGREREDLIREINQTNFPREAQELAKQHNQIDYDTKNWWYNGWKNPGYNVKAMRYVVRNKFLLNEDLKKILWKTGNKKLVEHTEKDNFWGDGGDGSGQNWLGKILMEVRSEITAKLGEYVPSKDPSTDKKDLIEKNIREIRTKLLTAGISAEQEIKILGNVWENSYLHQHGESIEVIENWKKEILKSIDEYIAKNSTDNSQKDKEKKGEKEQSPKNSTETTSEQINETRDKLNNTKNSNNKEEVIKILNDTREATKNSSDKNLKEERERLEDRLGQIDKSELRKIIKAEVENELKNLAIKPGDLTSDIKQKYDELSNDIEPTQTKAIRTQVLNYAAIQSLDKLITELKTALKSKEIKKIENELKKLQEFINSKNDYQKSAYEVRKNEVQQLLDQNKNQQSSPKNNQESGFFQMNNPVMWLSGVGAVSLLVGAILIVRGRCKRKKAKKHSKN